MLICIVHKITVSSHAYVANSHLSGGFSHGSMGSMESPFQRDILIQVGHSSTDSRITAAKFICAACRAYLINYSLASTRARVFHARICSSEPKKMYCMTEPMNNCPSSHLNRACLYSRRTLERFECLTTLVACINGLVFQRGLSLHSPCNVQPCFNIRYIFNYSRLRNRLITDASKTLLKYAVNMHLEAFKIFWGACPQTPLA